MTCYIFTETTALRMINDSLNVVHVLILIFSVNEINIKL